MLSIEALTAKRTEQVQKLKQRFIDSMVESECAYTTFTTCSCAPAFGWSVEEYTLMPRVAQEMNEEGFSVTSSINHGVTDWKISLK